MYIQQSTFETTLDLNNEKIRKFFRYLIISIASLCITNHMEVSETENSIHEFYNYLNHKT